MLNSFTRFAPVLVAISLLAVTSCGGDDERPPTHPNDNDSAETDNSVENDNDSAENDDDSAENDDDSAENDNNADVSPGVIVSDQTLTVVDRVTVSQVMSDGPGFVVIREQTSGMIGGILGFAPVSIGTNLNVAVDVTRFANDGETLYATLHSDDGDVGVFEFDGGGNGLDLPVSDMDGPIAAAFVVAVPEAIEPAVMVNHQVADPMDTVVVAKAVSVGPGWIVIHEDDGSGGIGGILGQALLSDGINLDVSVNLSRDAVDGETLYAMLYSDDGMLGTFEFDGGGNGLDLPVSDMNGVIGPSFVVTAPETNDEPPSCDTGVATRVYFDEDRDGYDVGSTILCVDGELEPRYALSTAGTDCNDLDGYLVGATSVRQDRDLDGFGDAFTGPNDDCASLSGRPAAYTAPPDSPLLDCDDCTLGSGEQCYLRGPERAGIPGDGVDNDCAAGGGDRPIDPNFTYVDSGVSGPGSGTQGDPYASLQDAIDNVPNSGTILAAFDHAIYEEGIVVDGKRFTLVGGYQNDDGTWTYDGSQTQIERTTDIGNHPHTFQIINGGKVVMANLLIRGPEADGLTDGSALVIDGASASLFNVQVAGPDLQSTNAAVDTRAVHVIDGTLYAVDSDIRAGIANYSGSASGATAAPRATVAGTSEVTLSHPHVFGSAALTSGPSGLTWSAGVRSRGGTLRLLRVIVEEARAQPQADGDGTVAAYGVWASGASEVEVVDAHIRNITAKMDAPVVGFDATAVGLRIVDSPATVVDSKLTSLSATADGGGATTRGSSIIRSPELLLQNSRVLGGSATVKAPGTRARSIGLQLNECGDATVHGNFIMSQKATGESGGASRTFGMWLSGGASRSVATGNVIGAAFADARFDDVGDDFGSTHSRGILQDSPSSSVWVHNTVTGGRTRLGSSDPADTAVFDAGSATLVNNILVAGDNGTASGMVVASGLEVALTHNAFTELDGGNEFTSFVVTSSGGFNDVSDINGCTGWTAGDSCHPDTTGNFHAPDFNRFTKPQGPFVNRNYTLIPGNGLLANSATSPYDLPAPRLGRVLRDFTGALRPGGDGWDYGAFEVD